MIAVMQVERWRDKGILEKIGLRFRRFPVKEEEDQSPWGSYRIFKVCDRRIDWAEWEAFANRRGVYLLVPKEAAPDGFPHFSDESFYLALLQTSLLSVFRRLQTPMGKRSLILADREGKYFHWLADWLFLCTVPKLVSENTDRCEALKRDYLEDYGAALLYHESLPDGWSGVLVDPDGWLAPWKGFNGVVFTAREILGKAIHFLPAKNMLSGWEPPPGILAEDFLSACYFDGLIGLDSFQCRGMRGQEIFTKKELIFLCDEACAGQK